ncbi:hypothetical protein HYPSUDRAFT_64635 [Hypholoma sublateritium FD-334 SS-4]|uniref:Uncharacterized protein n=1 Tax=Hypholoma sublateritium (strain FD-334 SS-4) TaxID=945553 RepID=A0A0D2MNA6_HYPSF|nr:hypothetical protein HYPSUDRAFT_64635 [Hypholoma sublateritium FD-334 SS-4]
MSNISQHIGRRGTVMAVACGLTIFGALEAMYTIDKDVKVHEGQSSPFEDKEHAAMTSAEVSEAVSIPKRGAPRLHVHIHPT